MDGDPQPTKFRIPRKTAGALAASAVSGFALLLEKNTRICRYIFKVEGLSAIQSGGAWV